MSCCPDRSPYATGGVGLLGTRASQEALESCDTLLIVGSSGCELEPIDFVRVAEGCDIGAIRIDDPARYGEQLREALATPGACLIEAVVDPMNRRCRPRSKPSRHCIWLKRSRKGTPHSGKIALTLASDTVRELV
jgi:pyruvate dehydrogenase (quinone)/pyruvate oxidase